MNKEPVYYRKTEIKEFKDFKDGDYICEVCNGWGYFYDCEDNRVNQCFHCLGKGKLDWVTNVTGAVGMSGTTGMSSSSAFGSGGTSGCGTVPPPPKGQSSGGVLRPIKPPPPPIPPAKRILGGKSLKYKATFHAKLEKQTIPHKKISLKERIMNAVADK